MSQVFTFQSNQIRTITENGNVLFAAKDVCAVLDIRWNGRNTLSAIPDDWQGVWRYHTPHGGTQNLIFMTEPALYKLAFRSNKPEADAFTNWVASEVLPAIRKTGKYEAPQQLSLPKPKPADPYDADPMYSGCRAANEKLRLAHDLLSEAIDIVRSIKITGDTALSCGSVMYDVRGLVFGTVVSIGHVQSLVHLVTRTRIREIASEQV